MQETQDLEKGIDGSNNITLSISHKIQKRTDSCAWKGNHKIVYTFEINFCLVITDEYSDNTTSPAMDVIIGIAGIGVP